MALPVIDGVLRCSVGGAVHGGGRWANTWHLQRVDLGAIDAPLVAEAHVALMAFYNTQVIAWCTSGTTLEAGDYTPLDGTSGAFHLPGGLVGPVPGTNASPPEVAEVLTIRTALRGRQNRGRIFLPAVGSNYFVNGQLHPDLLTGIPLAANVLQAALLVVGWTVGVASYGVSKRYDRTVHPPRVVENTWTPHFTPVSQFTMDGRADVIRNRKS